MQRMITAPDGIRLHVSMDRGRGHGMVFIHGMGVNKSIWKKERDYYRSKGYRTAAFDLRGHGQSDKPDGMESYKLQVLCDDTAAVVDGLGLHRPVLVGHSVGAAIALYTAARHPARVGAVVAISAALDIPAPLQRIAPLSPLVRGLTHLIARHQHIQHAEHQQAIDFFARRLHHDDVSFSEVLRNAPIKVLLAVFDTMHESYTQLNACLVLRSATVPSLFIVGTRDDIVAKEDVEHMAGCLPHSSIVELPVGHHAQISSPAAICRAMDAFFSRNLAEAH
ncbi:hypothetical protein COV94_03215 [Candidatus Woesearchaeota archaeon CG11_big_fil_rev_8_21_14_0_20_57_5]|nr:MAG: hypothetical protein COV94_03215 [Candidatus Woesearchaeota archaeon CG11_big_fil_rev_8_21_14_0_20_57_5]